MMFLSISRDQFVLLTCLKIWLEFKKIAVSKGLTFLFENKVALEKGYLQKN